MTSRLVLRGILAGLILVILAEWLIPDGGVARMTRPVSANAPGHRPLPPIVTLGAAALADKILARPLFLPGRRVPPPAPVARTTPDEKKLPLPRLTGILMAGGTRLAVFQIVGADKPVTASLGDAVSAWKVTGIKPNEVKLTGADGVATLTPSGDPNTAGPTQTDPEAPTVDPPTGADQ